MCLRIDSFYHKDYEPLTYNKNIEVIKCLHRTNNNFYTPCFNYPVQFHHGKAELTTSRFSRSSSSYYSIVNVEQGIHSFRSHVYFNKKLLLTFKAIIPKGTLFYIGKDADMVSLKLIIFKNWFAYTWYCLTHSIPIKSNYTLLNKLK